MLQEIGQLLIELSIIEDVLREKMANIDEMGDVNTPIVLSSDSDTESDEGTVHRRREIRSDVAARQLAAILGHEETKESTAAAMELETRNAASLILSFARPERGPTLAEGRPAQAHATQVLQPLRFVDWEDTANRFPSVHPGHDFYCECAICLGYEIDEQEDGVYMFV
jgi:hypothetical protein